MSSPKPHLNGQLFYVPGKPEIYWIDHGLARHIPDEATYHSVFGASPNRKAYKDLLSEVEAGSPLAHGAELVRAGNDPKIYFVENKIKRWIPNEAIKEKFQLKGDVRSLPPATVHGFVNGPEFVDPSPTHAPVEPAPKPHPVDPLPKPHPVDPLPKPHPVDPLPKPHPIDPLPKPHPVDPLPTPRPGSKVNTLNTPLGPINWIESLDGTISAEAKELKLVITGKSIPNVSGNSHLEYSTMNGQPYLSINFVWNEPEHRVSFSINKGASHLTLALSSVDAATNSGTYLLSGIWNGSAVNTTSKADLAINLRTCGPANGWPNGAFKAELEKVAVFDPLGTVLGKKFVARHAGPVREPGGAVIRKESTGAFFGKAAAACVIAGIGGFLAGPIGAVVGCLAGADASMAADDITLITEDQPSNPQPVNPQPIDPQPIVPPPIDPSPITPTPVTPVEPDPTPDDPVPGDPTPDDPTEGPVCVPGDGLDTPDGGGGGGGGGHHPIDSGDPTTEEN